MEKIENLAAMYRKGDITDYVMERELSAYLGSRATVKITDSSSTNLGKSYCIMPLPEKRAEGFHITYFLDREAIRTYYTAYEFGLVMEKVARLEQDILLAYNKFLSKHFNSDITYGTALGFILDLYLTFKTALDIKDGIEFLPEDSKVREAVVKLQDGEYKESDLEALLVDNTVSKSVLDYVKKYVKEFDLGGGKILIVKDATEIPLVNLGAQQILPYCTSTFGTRDHKDIPHDYMPTTNQ